MHFSPACSDQGRVLLGGDVSVNLVHRPATAEEHAFLARKASVRNASMRAMAYARDKQADANLSN